MRLIDADALRVRMYHEAFETDTDMQKWDSGCWIRYKLFENCIDAAPTLSPDEVRGVGEWEKVRDRGGYLTPGGTPIVRCSACGGAEHLSGVEFPETFRFCPSCGARMKGADDGTTE